MAARLAPKKYGDRVEHHVRGGGVCLPAILIQISGGEREDDAKLIEGINRPVCVRFRANRTSSRHGPRTESDPNPGTGRIEIPQYSGFRPHRGEAVTRPVAVIR